MRYDNLNNDDYRCLNEKDYIYNDNNEIWLKFYELLVKKFLDENFSRIYRIEIEKILSLKKLLLLANVIETKFEFVIKKIEYSNLVE